MSLESESNVGSIAKPNGTKVRAFVYERISEDPDGEEENIEIRLEECRAYCAAQGWVIIAEYPDNDIPASRYSKKPRPKYNEMFQAVAAGACEVIVTTEMERLYRRLEELLELIKLAERTPLRRIQCTDGSAYDLSSGPGIHGAINAVNNGMLESRKLSDRMKRKKAAKASNGYWWGGARPFGYQLDEREGRTRTGKKYIYYVLEIDPVEAKLIKDGVERALAGETATGIARDWVKRGIRGARGALPDTTEVRRMLTSAHIAGLRAHTIKDEHGNEETRIVEGNWTGIIDRETWEQVCATLKRTPLPHEIKQPRKYLLTGILACSCGALLHAHGRDGKREYECRKIDGGCGHTRRKAEPIEDAVRDRALVALANPAVREALEDELRARQATSETVRDLVARREQDRKRLDVLRDQLADGMIEPPDFKHAKARINERLGGIERALASMSRPEATLLDSLPTTIDGLEAAWAKAVLDRRRAILRLVLNRVIALPIAQRRRTFDAKRELGWDWKV